MPLADFRSPRLFVDAPLATGAGVALDRAQANYLGNVLRLGAGDTVLVFNGRDGEWRAAIEGGKRPDRLAVREQTRIQDRLPDLACVFAPLKHARLDYMVQKAVEMGAAVLQPVITRHTQVARVNGERMRANAIEAAEQCGILSIPDCREAMRLDALLDRWEADRILVFADEAAEETNPLDALRTCRGRPLGLLIGPEGGFSQAERDRLAALGGAITISLGPRILRADTAAVAALAVIQAACGDW